MSSDFTASGLRSIGARALAEFLTDEIRNGRLSQGVKLPGERELSARFNTSRGSVRKVLNALKEQGWLTQSAGSGTFAARPPHLGPSDAEALFREHTSPAELMEARMLIEPLMPQLIVRNATRADFSRMHECLVQSERAATVEEFEHWDGELHRALAGATHNQFFLQVLALMSLARQQDDWGRLKRNSLTPQRRGVYQGQHRKIVAALEDRDAETAREALMQHLVQIRANLFDSMTSGA
jgi:Transcriptional regulators